MTRLTPSECRSWIDRNEFLRDGHHIYPSGRQVYAIDFSQPLNSRAIAVVAKHIADVYGGCPEVILFVDEWGVWPTDEIFAIFNRALAGYGDGRPLAEAPGFLFADSDHADLKDIVQITIMSGWSGVVVSPTASMGFSFSDDEWIGLYSDSESEAQSWYKSSISGFDVNILWQGKVCY